MQAAVTTLAPYGLWAVAGTDGEALFADVPPGKAELSVSLLGYETVSLTVELKAETEDSVRIAMMPSSFAMKEVVVVAENNKSGLSTSSSIGRQALDHLQATSLKDVPSCSLVIFLGSNPSLISTGQFRNRTLEADNNNAFGGSIVVDGIPLSNNANLNVEAGAFSTAGKGIDLRGIGTDNIESIEVIRGIASARYGDMSSGTMLIKKQSRPGTWSSARADHARDPATLCRQRFRSGPRRNAEFERRLRARQVRPALCDRYL